MGDAGSMMIGFTVIWLLLSASQANNQNLMRPVTALWIIALPLMVLYGLSSTFAGIGIVGEYYQVAESLMFVGFLGCFVTYTVLLLRNWPKRMSELLEERNLVSFEANTINNKVPGPKVDSK